MSWHCTCEDCGADYTTDKLRVANGWERRHNEAHDYSLEEIEDAPEVPA